MVGRFLNLIPKLGPSPLQIAACAFFLTDATQKTNNPLQLPDAKPARCAAAATVISNDAAN
ncbi:hypothetical protein TH8_10255 [Thalassospira profundimaris]|nr:hypothetical protein TH8_10255 [Thalassospira profundimaris]